MGNIRIYRSSERGFADHGWLKARHSFSFAGYYDPEKVHFGALRVLNDDVVAPGMGFGTHPHDNMEIITIPLSGALEHRDSMGNHGVISAGEIQVMSAGTGIEHSEFNHSKEEEVNIFQLWIFPHTRGVSPRYDQMSINGLVKDNTISQIISPDSKDEGSWIYQDAWLHLGRFSESMTVEYSAKREGNIVYLMNIEGMLEINDSALQPRDAAASEDGKLTIKTSPGSYFLVIDVPKKW